MQINSLNIAIVCIPNINIISDMHDRYTTLPHHYMKQHQLKSGNIRATHFVVNTKTGMAEAGGGLQMGVGLGRIEGAAGQRRWATLLPPPPDFQI